MGRPKGKEAGQLPRHPSRLLRAAEKCCVGGEPCGEAEEQMYLVDRTVRT